MFLRIRSPAMEEFLLYDMCPKMGTGISLDKSLPREMEPLELASNNEVYPGVTEEMCGHHDKIWALLAKKKQGRVAASQAAACVTLGDVSLIALEAFPFLSRWFRWTSTAPLPQTA